MGSCIGPLQCADFRFVHCVVLEPISPAVLHAGEMKIFLRSLPKHWVLHSNLIYSKRALPASSPIELAHQEWSQHGPLQALCDSTQPYRMRKAVGASQRTTRCTDEASQPWAATVAMETRGTEVEAHRHRRIIPCRSSGAPQGCGLCSERKRKFGAELRNPGN